MGGGVVRRHCNCPMNLTYGGVSSEYAYAFEGFCTFLRWGGDVYSRQLVCHLSSQFGMSTPGDGYARSELAGWEATRCGSNLTVRAASEESRLNRFKCGVPVSPNTTTAEFSPHNPAGKNRVRTG